MAKAVKLADIAEQLGVSTVTVSKALSGQKGVSEAMREKIKQLADELGYKQPSAVKKEKSVKSYNIGVLVSEKYLGEYASFYWRMYQSVATRAVQKECFTMLEVVSLEDEAEANLPKIVLERSRFSPVEGRTKYPAVLPEYSLHLQNAQQNIYFAP